MMTRKGIENTLVGLLIEKIDECNKPNNLARDVANEIIDYLTEEKNLTIPHVIKCEHISSTPEEAWKCDDCEEFTGWKED